MEQSNICRSTGIVFDGCYFCRYAVFIALEIDQTDFLLVAATDMTYCNTAMSITAALSFPC